MQTETITLGERKYTLAELPLRKASAFREKLRAVFAEVTDVLEGGPDTQLNDSKAVAHLIRSVSNTVLSSVDTAFDMLCEYSADIKKDRKHLEENAVGSQVVDAFLAMLKLLFPFLSSERGARITRSLAAIGSADKPTSTN